MLLRRRDRSSGRAFLRKTFRDRGHQLESYKVQPMDGKPSPHVVVIGAGFGGLLATRALARYPVRVTLIDRKNFHTFQPLLYQVATAGLSPGEIAAPIRWILRGYRNRSEEHTSELQSRGQ